MGWFNSVAKKVEKAVEKAVDTVKDGANAVGDGIKDGANAAAGAISDAANDTKHAIGKAANVGEQALVQAADATRYVAEGAGNELVKQGEQAVSAAIKDGVPALQEVAKLSKGAVTEINGQLDAALSTVGIDLSEIESVVGDIAQKAVGVVNYLMTEVLNEIMKALLLKKAMQEIENHKTMIDEVLKFYQKNKQIPSAMYEVMEKSGLGSLGSFKRGGDLSSFPFAKYLGSSISMALAGSAGKGLGAETSIGQAEGLRQEKKNFVSIGGGLMAPGASGGIQFAYWKADPGDLTGPYWAVSLGGVTESGIGYEAFVAFDTFSLEFQGVGVGVVGGTPGISASVTVGLTKTL